MIESDLQEQFGPREPVRPRSRLKILISLLVVGVLGLGSTGAYVAWAMGGTATGKPVRVIVPEGAPASRIAELLAQKDVVRSAFVFRLVARFRGAAFTLKPGAYDLRTGLGVDGAIAALRKGIPLDVARFTVPEGKNILQIADIVDERTHISRVEFLRAVRSGEHRSPIAPAVRNLEGLLFPQTYLIDEKQDADDVVELMLRQLAEEMERAGLALADARAQGLSPYEALIAASLIEREASIARDRPLVASVIYNRLRRPMRLQIDATVQYAIQLKTGTYKGTLLQRSDYADVKSPYNTYLIDGLPPTPIASPGIEAIRAVMRPAKTDFYFYKLCDENQPSAGHVFGATLGAVDRQCR